MGNGVVRSAAYLIESVVSEQPLLIIEAHAGFRGDAEAEHALAVDDPPVRVVAELDARRNVGKSSGRPAPQIGRLHHMGIRRQHPRHGTTLGNYSGRPLT